MSRRRRWCSLTAEAGRMSLLIHFWSFSAMSVRSDKITFLCLQPVKRSEKCSSMYKCIWGKLAQRFISLFYIPHQKNSSLKVGHGWLTWHWIPRPQRKKSKYPFLPVGCNKVFHNFLTVCCTYKKKITFHVLYFILAFNHFISSGLQRCIYFVFHPERILGSLLST